MFWSRTYTQPKYKIKIVLKCSTSKDTRAWHCFKRTDPDGLQERKVGWGLKVEDTMVKKLPGFLASHLP